MVKYSKQELIQEIQRVSKEHCGGDTPRVKDMKKYSNISYATYSNRFGCWSKAQKYCGFEPNKNSVSKQKLIDELKRLSEEHCGGDRPTTGDLKEHGKFSRPTYTNNFKSFWTALRKAGFDVEGEHGNLAQYSVSNEEIKQEIKRLSTIEDGEIARFPTKVEFGEKGKFSNSLFHQRFGSYSKCLIELFDCELPRRRGFEISDDVFENILQKVKEFPKNKCKYSAPTSEEFKEEYSYADKKILNYRIGSWNQILERAGWEPNSHTDVSRSELLDEIKRMSQEYYNGETPTTNNMKNECKYSQKPFKSEFGSWNEAVKQAGFEPNVIDWKNMPSGEDHPAWKGGSEVKYYGPSWYKNKQKVRKRDGNCCRVCGVNSKEKYGLKPDIHHIAPADYWKVEEEHEVMNNPRNLISLCKGCHKPLEGKFKARNQEEFEKLAREYLEIEKQNNGVEKTIFDY